MHTEEMKTCPKCQAPVPAEAPQGLCPKCLLAGVSTGTEAGQPGPPETAAPLASVAAVFPQLDVLEFVGQGGMGMVYKARQRHLQRVVALKLLPEKAGADPTFSERFHREARVLARLSHPHIVAVYDFGQVPGFFYLLMEYVDGVNLRQAMRAGRFTPEQALALVPKICDALQYAHDEGILHRDIKPENLLLDTRGRVKIADFGIAKLLGETQDLALTASGAAIGTPHYMAPEQFERPDEVDQRADIFSLGVVFYEMLTGELPIGRFAPPSEKAHVDSRVDQVVFRALERERERRFQTAEEVKTRVENITANPLVAEAARAGVQNPQPSLSGNPPAPTPAAAKSPDRPPTTLHRWRRKAVAGILIVGCSLFGLLFLCFIMTVGHVPPGPAFVLLMLVAVPGAAGTWASWSALRSFPLQQAGPKILWLVRLAALGWPVVVGDVALFLTLVLSARNLEVHLFHMHNAALTTLAAVFGVAGIAALNWSLGKEWVKRWGREPLALPLAEQCQAIRRLPRLALWGLGVGTFCLFLILFRTGFRMENDTMPPGAMNTVNTAQPNPPPGYEIPPDGLPGNDWTYHSGVSVPAGYALTLTATLWSNQVPIRLGGPNNAVFLVSSKNQPAHGHVMWRSLGNGALADGAPLEFSLNLDGTPESATKTFHVVSPQEVALDWVGEPSQLWPPQNAHTKFLLVKGQSARPTIPLAAAVPATDSPDAASGPTDGGGPAEWAVGIEARLDPIPERWVQALGKPRVGLGTNWVSLFDTVEGSTQAGAFSPGAQPPNP